MDELTLLRSTRDDTLTPSESTLDAGRAALMARIAEPPNSEHLVPKRRRRRPLRRATWIAAGTAAVLTGILVAGNVNLGVQSAQANEVLRQAAAAAVQFSDLAPGAGQYLRITRHEKYPWCEAGANGEMVCAGTNEESTSVYVPANRDDEWVQVRDWGDFPGKDEPETHRARNGDFYGPDEGGFSAPSPEERFADIPLDGAAAYDWIHAQYVGGSASPDEDDFVRITDLLRSGLVPAPQRAALLDALSRIPGVTSRGDVMNLDGVEGVAIGREEPMRLGNRDDIIVDPATGQVIGERTVSGTTFFGWGVGEVVSSSAMSVAVVDEAP